LDGISHGETKYTGNEERDMPTIVHFQIPVDDIERSKKFYNDLFGWKFEKFSPSPGSEAMPEEMEYWLVSTVDNKGNKAVGGGMMKRQSQQQGITNYYDMKSVQEYSAKVEKLGGKVITPRTPIPGMGYFAVCTDSENNGFGIFESDENTK
jgi:predicted enzyme related to lactoylglutathione lyase